MGKYKFKNKFNAFLVLNEITEKDLIETTHLTQGSIRQIKYGFRRPSHQTQVILKTFFNMDYDIIDNENTSQLISDDIISYDWNLKYKAFFVLNDIKTREVYIALNKSKELISKQFAGKVKVSEKDKDILFEKFGLDRNLIFDNSSSKLVND